MTENAERVKRAVLELPENERAELAQLLIQSLDQECDANAEAAWDAELERRLKRLEDGSARLSPAFEVLAEITNKYK